MKKALFIIFSIISFGLSVFLAYGSYAVYSQIQKYSKNYDNFIHGSEPDIPFPKECIVLIVLAIAFFILGIFLFNKQKTRITEK